MEVISLIVAGVASLVFGAMIGIGQPRQAAARFFFLTTLGIAAWSLGIAAFLMGQSSDLAVLYMKVYYTGAALIAVAMLSVAAAVSSVRHFRTLLLASWLCYMALMVMIGLDINLLLTLAPDGRVLLHMAGYSIYALYFLVLFFATLFLLRYQARRQCGVLRRSQLKLLFYAYGIAGVIGVAFNLILPMFDNYKLIWVGPLSTFIFIPLLYTTIVRHRLFGLKDTVVRAVAYALLISLLVLVYYAGAYLIQAIVMVFGGDASSGAPGMVGVFLALLLGFLFQPAKQFFDRFTDRLFYQQGYRLEDFVTQVGHILTRTAGLRLLAARLIALFEHSFKTHEVMFAVYDRDKFRIFGAKSGNRPSQADLRELARHFDATHPEGVYAVDGLEGELQQILKLYKVTVVVGLALRDDVIGFMLFGKSRKGGYSERDMAALSAVRGEIAIAIANAQAIEEIRELNEQLQLRVDLATKELRQSNAQLQRLDKAKNEFISMASHQLRTPLTSIKGYLDMLLEGDLGTLTPTQKTVLREAFMSSERMVQLINDFLNVSRLQTGKFVINRDVVNLGDVAREEVSLLGVVARQRGVTVKLTVDKNIPLINVDSEKLRQVIMNMIDNAIYYSKKHGVVQVSMKQEVDHIIFMVKDHGIGVPKEEQSGLFGKFFRASNARKRRPDGTGVGLFLARKVILLHGGQVIFESEEGKGSTFGFRLPLRQPAAKRD